MRFVISLIYMTVIVAFAIRRGDAPERAAASLLIGSLFGDAFYHAVFGGAQFVTVDPGHVVIDFILATGFLTIALRANRGWPLWVCSAQLIVMLGHFGKVMEIRDVYRGYWVMTQLPVLMQLAFLGFGTLAHTSRLKVIGPYHAWRLS